MVAVVVGGLCSVVGWGGAQLGLTGAVAAVGALGTATALVFVRERQLVVLAGTVLSLTLLLHKALGPLVDNVASGAVGLTMSSLYVMIVLLYLLWLFEGTLVRDVVAALRRPVFWAPLAGGLLSSLSLLVAFDTYLALSELFRMGWMYLLFLYVGARLRTRREVWTVLGALAAFAVVQLGVSVLQWRTGGVLGLGALGVPTALTERTLDAGQVGRPFGTMIHPVFLGAVLAVVALMALSLAIHLDRRRLRLAALAVLPLCLLPIALAHARGPAVALVVAAGLLVAGALARGRLSWRPLAVAGAVTVVLLLALWPQVSGLVRDNFRTRHVGTELDARFELNQVGLRMFYDGPVLGAGLNNFTQVMARYAPYRLLFPGFPSHNLFLVQLAETGVVGLAGLVLVGGTLTVAAVRLARSRDALFAAVGTGLVAIYGFWLIEELFSYTLREEVPLALFWILAGVGVACQRMDEAGRPGRRRPPRGPRELGGKTVALATVFGASSDHPGPVSANWSPSWSPGRPGSLPIRRSSNGHGRRFVVAALGAATLGLPLVVGGGAGAASAAEGPRTSDLAVVFAAYERDTGIQAIYTADGDGGRITRVSTDVTANDSWPVWAADGRRILFTSRRGPAGSPENVFVMNPDGSGRRQLTFGTWRVDQPKMSPDGTQVIFTGFAPESPEVALYSLDLRTLLVTNLTARSTTGPSLDSDPRWTPDGRIVFADTLEDGRPVPTKVWIMQADGSGRRRLSGRDDPWFDVDPAMAPDGRRVAYGSYRGEGPPAVPGEDGALQIKLHDWVLVVRDLAGREQVLTEGGHCYQRPVDDPCDVTEGPAAVPVWTPDGRGIGFVSVLSAGGVCICVVDAETGVGRRVVASDQLAITWFDWAGPGGPGRDPAATDAALTAIGTAVPPSRLLFGGVDTAGSPVLATSPPDRWVAAGVGLPAGLAPTSARWSADRTRIVFSAAAPYDESRFLPQPPPPPGEHRRVHVTLDRLSRFFDPPRLAAGAEDQVFLYDVASRKVRPLTTPWTEDYMDALPDGEARANVDPDIAPDGTSVIFTNVSPVAGESALLRLDLETGAVYNLTNATAGAVPVADTGGRFSPDGRLIAFSSGTGGGTGIHVMDAATGRAVTRITEDGWLDVSPAWSPDGRSLAYSSWRGEPGGPGDEAPPAAPSAALPDWHLVTVDRVTGRQLVLTGADASPALRPAWSPDGRQIAYISLSDPGQPDIWVVPAAGGRPRPLQVSFLTREAFVDWR